MKITQALLDHLGACKDGNKVGYELGVIGSERDVTIQKLRDAGYDQYADWVEKVTRTSEAVRFSGGELSGIYKYFAANKFLYFQSYEEAYRDREKLIRPIFLQNEKLWFPVCLEIKMNDQDVAWAPIDIYEAPDHAVFQIFNMFTGCHHRFENKSEASLYRNEIIERRMSAFRAPIFQELRSADGDSAWEVVDASVRDMSLRVA